jgi:uncharacterized protein (TIGR03067 family)
MANRMRVAALGFGLVSLLAPQARAADSEEVKSAIERGVTHLKSIQGPDGYWQYENNVGATALAALTLLECNVDRDDPAVQKAAQAVRKGSIILNHTYSIALAIMFLDRMADGQDTELLDALTRRLLRGQNGFRGWGYLCPLDPQEMRRLTGTAKERDGRDKKDGGGTEQPAAPGLPPELQKQYEQLLKKFPAAGGQVPVGANLPGANPWANFDRSEGDNSNTQFATLALWVARRHKFALPIDNALARVEKRFRLSQNPDGGWSYLIPVRGQGPNLGTTPSMTCAGLLGLGIAYGVGNDILLHANLKPQDVAKTSSGKAKEPLDPNRDPNVRAGLLVLGSMMLGTFSQGRRNFALGGAGAFPPGLAPKIAQNRPEQRLPVDYYALWSIERVALAYDLKTIAKLDWYSWGARILLEAQAGDGSWSGSYREGGCDTCFALLFLSRSNLASDLTDSMKGKMRDPAEVKLTSGGVGGESIKNRDSAHGGVLAEKAEGEDKSKTGSIPKLVMPTDGGVEPPLQGNVRRSSGDDKMDIEIAKLCAQLVRAQGDQQTAVLDRLREGRGVVYTEALAMAIPQLTGPGKTKAREALAERMARMKATTLREKFTEGDLEIRRAAALASAMKEDKSFIPELLKLLGDAEPPVARAAHAALKALSNKDFGPGDDASLAERRKALEDWKAWWAQQNGAGTAKTQSDAAPSPDDKDKLQGTWIVVRIEGKTSEQAREAVKKELLEFVFDGDQFSIQTPGGQPLEKAVFTIDPAQKTKQIDFTKTDDLSGLKTVTLGIYAWEGDQLKLCLSEVNQARPAEFKTKATGKRVIFSMKRKKS